MSEQKEETDLVTTLRQQAEEMFKEERFEAGYAMVVASNEIERLRKLCRRFADILWPSCDNG